MKRATIRLRDSYFAHADKRAPHTNKQRQLIEPSASCSGSCNWFVLVLRICHAFAMCSETHCAALSEKIVWVGVLVGATHTFALPVAPPMCLGGSGGLGGDLICFAVCGSKRFRMKTLSCISWCLDEALNSSNTLWQFLFLCARKQHTMNSMAVTVSRTHVSRQLL